jgi:hypothetical protein
MGLEGKIEEMKHAVVHIDQGPTSDSEGDIVGSADISLATFSYLEPVIPRRPKDDIQLGEACI